VVGLAEYHFNLLSYAPDLILVKPYGRTFSEGFEKEYGVGVSVESLYSYNNLYVLVDVLERAGSTDREKIRETFTKTNITQGKALPFSYKKIEFGPDGQNPHVGNVVCQWQKGKLRVVYPSDVAPPDVKLIWPAPPWD